MMKCHPSSQQKLDPFIQAEVNSERILTITRLMYGSPGAQVPIKVLLCVGQVARHSVAPFGLRLSLGLTGGSRIFCTMALHEMSEALRSTR